MKNLLEDYLWVVQISAFCFFYFFFSLGIIYSIILAFAVYCIVGGWRFVRILYYTLPRDIRGLIILIRVTFGLRRMMRNHYFIPDLFAETVDQYGGKTAMLCEEQVWSFGQLDAYSNRVANLMLEAGYKSGDVVALFMESRPIYVAIWMGMAKIGIVPALINYNLRLDSLIHCIHSANAKALVFGRELSPAVSDVKEALAGLPLYCADGGSNAPADVNGTGAVLLEDLVYKYGEYRPPCVRKAGASVKDPLVYIYTSGTTGMPKAAVVTHARYYLMAIGVCRLLRVSPNDIIYNPLPLYHTAGGILGVGQCLLNGTTIVVRRKFSASRFWDECVQYRATIIQYIGETCRYLLAQPVRPSESMHSVRLAFGNGIRPQIWVDFQRRFGVKQIGEFYGATESNANIVNSENKVGAVGFTTRILPHLYPVTLIRIDPITGEPMRNSRGLCIKCGPGEPGELVGKIVDTDPLRRFDGYVNSSASAKKVVYNVFHKGDKAFLSGDILEMDDLGFFYFRDRVGDTYRWRGENVSTAEVEAVVSNVAGLADCVVFGVEIPECEGRAGMAAIADPEGKMDLAHVARELTRLLPPYARPVFVRLCKEIDMTGTFKMKKLDLVKVCYNPSLTTDPLFMWDQRANTYRPLDVTQYAKIMQGQSGL